MMRPSRQDGNRNVLVGNAGVAYTASMSTLTIRNVDPELKEELRVRAARHGRSMEAELRLIIKEALRRERQRPEPNLAEAIRRRLLPLGGADDIAPHPPVPVGEPPRLRR
jgi:plasmid stability protein